MVATKVAGRSYARIINNSLRFPQGPGINEWLHAALAYQNDDIKFRYADATFCTFNLWGTVAGFIGYDTYITSFPVSAQSVVVNGNRLQGL